MRACDLRRFVACAAIASCAAGSAKASLVISNKPTRNLSCSAGLCTTTAKSAVMNVADLTDMLASFDVALASGGLAKDVEVKSAFSWASASRLTLDAYRSIVFERSVTVAGTGALTLTTNDGGKDGTLSFVAPGRGHFWNLSSSLVINGASYTLVGDIATLASDIAANPSGSYALANDYDARPDGTYVSSPIPTTLTGLFEGLGNAISGLVIHADHGKMRIGLFASIGTGAAVENIGLENVTIRGSYGSDIGALASENYGSITGAFAKGNIRGGNLNDVGGLVGLNTGPIRSSYTTGSVIGGNSFVGGLVGGSAGNNGPSISNSHSTAEVSGAVDAKVGGLVGNLIGSLTNSWASAAVSTADDDGQDGPPASAGGLVGYYFMEASDQDDFRNCYATGTVTGGQGANVGGLFGTILSFGGAPINASYSTGHLLGGAGSYIGGFIGYINAEAFVDAYWDTDASGVSDPSRGVGNVSNEPGITGLTDAQLKSGLPAGFDPSIWAQSPAINGGYPYLIADPPPP